jgi:hypothetical protein
MKVDERNGRNGVSPPHALENGPIQSSVAFSHFGSMFDISFDGWVDGEEKTVQFEGASYFEIRRPVYQ